MAARATGRGTFMGALRGELCALRHRPIGWRREIRTNPEEAVSERIDVVDDRDLPQQDAANDVRRSRMLGVDGGLTGAAGWQALGDGSVVKGDAHDERRSANLRRSCGQPRGLYLPRRDRLEDRLNAPRVYSAGQKLEGNLDLLALGDVAGVGL